MNPRWRTWRTVLGFAGAYLVAGLANYFSVGSWLYYRALAARFDDTNALSNLALLVIGFVGGSYIATLVLASIAASIGALVRMVARARLRAGLSDPLARLRGFVAKRPRLTSALSVVPALLWTKTWTGLIHRVSDRDLLTLLTTFALPFGLTFLAQWLLTRRGIRALVTPTLGEAKEGDAKADGFSFDAVAVTKQTIGAVAGLGLMSLVMLIVAYTLPTTTLLRHPAFGAALLSYFALTAVGTALFRRASKIKVGLDGIYVSGSTRAKFIAYHDIDTARANGVSIELVRGTKIVMRLQLHGEDAMRRDALAERIRDAIAVAAAQRNEPAVDFVKSATPEALERAAGGAASYREAAPTREKLWEMLESPAVDAAGRSAAASALAMGLETSAERTRLRVAAEACAEPTVRARIHELLEGDEEEEHDEAPIAPKRALLRG